MSTINFDWERKYPWKKPAPKIVDSGSQDMRKGETNHHDGLITTNPTPQVRPREMVDSFSPDEIQNPNICGQKYRCPCKCRRQQLRKRTMFHRRHNISNNRQTT